MDVTEAPRRTHVLPREKWWWLGLALLLTLASWLYIRGYMGSLPFLDHVDEPNHLLSAQHLIDEGSARNPLWYDAYPPGMYRLHYALLKHIKPPDPNFRDPGMVVLRLYPIQNPHDGRLGPIRLVGYDISATQLQAGEDLVFRHYWQAEMPTGSKHHDYNHLLDEAGEIVAQADFVPLWDNRRDSTTWDDPDEIMLGREFMLNLPPDLAPGSYQLVSGLYDPETWQRLQSPGGGGRLVIAQILIPAPAP